MAKITLSCQNYGMGIHSIKLKGMTQEEVDQFLCAIREHSWFKIEDGRLRTRPCCVSIPDPAQDEEILPFWPQLSHHQPQDEYFEKVFREMSDDVIYQPHITIQSLCGRNRTPENYVREAEKLKSYGFVQLRSKRGEDGDYWEIWYLPGVWHVKGDLKRVVDNITAKAKTWEDPHGRRKDQECFKAVYEFLRRNASFGVLDVSIKRLYQVSGD